MEVARILTLGQSDVFQDLINWGVENEVIDGLELIIDCSLVRHPLGVESQLRLLATIIKRLSSDAALAILSKWSNHSSYAYNLFKLVNTYHSTLPKHLIAEAYSDSKPARLQLHGELEIYYLASCLIEQKPNKSAQISLWYEQLKVWLVLRSMHAASFNIIQDEHLRVLFRYLRIAAEKQSNKLDLLNELMVDAQGYYPFTRALEHKANQLLSNSTYKDTDVIFLRTLIKVRNGDFHPDKYQQLTPIYQAAVRASPAAQLIANNNFNDELINDNETSIADLSDEDEADLCVKAKVNPDEAYEIRLLKGNSVLLNTVEELQYLPWQWNRPNSFEANVLVEINNRLIASEIDKERILGVTIWIALNTARSFRRAQNIQFGEVGNEWTINLQKQKLIRNQPRRNNAWLPKTEEEKNWILPQVEKQEIKLPEVVVEIIKNALIKHSKASYLKELWNEAEWGGDEKMFLDVFRNTLPRITPGMLGNYLPLKIYQQSENEKLARLLASHPNTGLPPASVYASWLNDEHPQIFNQFISKTPVKSPIAILAGSNLYPVESLIVEAIDKAGAKIEEIRKKGDLIAFHNCITGYIYTMILAGSGCRPISDLAESISQFDFENSYFYVDDKSTSRGNKARLLTIPDKLTSYVKNEYLAHLRIVANEMKSLNVDLADEIDHLSQAKHTSKLPFLFLLKLSEKIDWVPVTPSEVEKLSLFEWPLPSNLLRHRLAKLLPREDVFQEIVDGFLGHMESGLETYGDYSTRRFIEDVKTLRPAVNKLFDKLGFAYPKHQPYLKIDQPTERNDEFKAKLFGTQNRARERKARVVNAMKSVRWEIEKSLREESSQSLPENSIENSNEYPLEKLSEQQIDALSKTMLFYASGLPRADGALRYAYLLKCINRRVNNTSHKIKLKKQYFFSESNSPFTPLSINAQAKYTSILDAVTEILVSKHASRIPVIEAALLSTLIFSTENRVTDLIMLKNAFVGKYYRIIKLKEQYYVEFSSEEVFETSSPCVKRIPITKTCAFWMQHTKKLNLNSAILNKSVPIAFNKIISTVTDITRGIKEIESVEKLLKALSETIDQANVIELPGVIAGALSGRVSTYSWNWAELVRLNVGEEYRFDFKSYNENYPEINEDAGTEFVSARTSLSNVHDEETLKKNAKELFKEVRKILTKAESENDSKNKFREEYIKYLNALTNTYKDKVSQSCLFLVDWVIKLIKTKRTKTRYLAISTIERYFSALSTKFELLAYANNLIELDEDEITELYSQIILLSKVADRPYVGVRLLSFHRWVRELGVEEPDWEEIDVPDQQDTVSAGFIFEKDYQNGLNLLVQATTEFDINHYYCGLLMLLTFRFGLRGNEALGLMKSDILIEGDLIVISVQDNKLRKLKNTASRRQVPLVLDLSDSEKHLINWSLNHLASIPNSNQSTPLFNTEGEPFSKAAKAKIKHQLNSLLKLVTSNPKITIHHARHTAVNKIAYSLYGISSLCKKKSELGRMDRPSSVLLGTESHTRRESWATARYLGHATRITQFKSYIHFMWDWAVAYATTIETKKHYQDIKGVIDLDQYLVKTGSLDFKLSEIIHPEKIKENVTLVDMIQFFQLLANGKKVELAAETLGISLETANYAYSLLSAVSLKSERFQLTDSSLGIFQKTSPAAWKRLYEFIKTIDDESLAKIDNSDIHFDRLLPMFGSRGHVLMRAGFQFKIMKAFIEIFDVSQTTYDVLAPKNADKKIMSLAENYNFKPIIIGSNTPKGQDYKDYQLDTYVDNIEDESFIQRCGIVFKHENTGYARNSNNWMLILIIFITYLRSTQIKHYSN